MAATVHTYPASPPTFHSSDDINVKQEHGDHEYHQNPTLPQVSTPPTTDEGSHKDDDAASSSSLSDLDDTVDLDTRMRDFDEEENRQRFEDAARAGAEAEQHAQIKPHHYEGGIPVFQPNMEEFRDFQAFMTQADAYGMQSGIIKIIPPQEWKDARKPLDDLVKHIKIKNPITQEFHGAQGVYTQRNMEKSRSYSLPQWKATCEQTENQPPAKRGEKRLNADKLLGRGSTKKKSEGTPQPEGTKRRGRPPKKRENTAEPGSIIAAPPTPTSPESKPVVIKTEDADETVEPRETTPAPGKKPRKPRGRQPKSTVKREPGGGKSTETTVAARRLRNAREAVDFVDEEAFKDFDYRVYDNDQWTQERCDELEEKYWKSLNFSNPMYAADMPGSLFDEDTKEWNVAKLPNLLDLLGAPIPGVNTAYLYLGMWRATFAWHLEDVDLYSINYIHFGAPKQWYSISQKDAPKFEAAMKSIWPQDAKDCDQFLRHKTYLVSPAMLKSKYNVEVNKIVHREGEFIVTYPIGYHSGYNLGYNCAESVNFAIENWLQYGKTSRKCQCEADSVFIDVDWFVRRMNGEPSPEYEEVEITDDEDDMDDIGTPAAETGLGRGKSAQKRKRPAKDAGPNKKAKKIVKIRKVSRNQPCCLCPNDFPWDELLPTTHGQRAHRVCAMYTPETYIATEEGTEKVFNVENISKARLDLRCHECKQKKGSCFQCSSAKCTRAYHATCAMHAGVQVDKGEIAIWHEGVEYRDIGFDWRCKLHRTVKRSRITSDLSRMDHASNWLDNKELHEHIIGLAKGDVIQWQAFHGDEILAGVVESEFDPGQNSLLVRILPDLKTIREVDPAWILFVDSSTSCLQRPSANALDLPEDLQGKTAQVPGSTEKKPSEGDPFTEHPKTEWAEFVVEPPPHNKWQKKVDLTKDKQIFYFLGKSSTDTKAQYTADPNKPIHDPASNFLDTVEPPKMAPPPQPRRQSLAATYPMMPYGPRNTTTIHNVRHQSQSPHVSMPQRSAAMITASREKAFEMERTGQPPKPSQLNDLLAAAQAKTNEQARIQQRQLNVSTYVGQGSFQSAPNGIGIDQSAVARQKQFQQQAAQKSRSMSSSSHSSPHQSPPLPLYTTNTQMTAYRPYHNIAPTYYSNDTPRYGFSPQSMQFTTDWMNPPGRSPAFPSPAMPTMESHSPEMAFKQPANYTQSPTMMQNPPYMPTDQKPPQQPQQGNSFLGDSAVSRGTGGTHSNPSLKKEASSTDSVRTILSSLPPPRTPTEVERQRRISNPSWPFKSPEQIMAQKGEREKNGSQSSGSRPVSRPGSGYSTKAFPSPRLHAIPYGPEPQPPMYINPTATQISAPATGHSRAKSMSVSTGTGKMGPPTQPTMPPFRRSMSSNNLVPMNLDTKRELVDLRANVSSLPVFGPMPPPSRSRRSTMNSTAAPPIIEGPIAPPSPELQSCLESRPTTRSGTPTNDRPPPPALVSWRNHPGFWGKIASYFGQKHECAATVYKSPFGVGSNPDLSMSENLGLMQGASTIGNDGGLAGRWLTDLESSRRDVVEHWKIDHPIGTRP